MESADAREAETAVETEEDPYDPGDPEPVDRLSVQNAGRMRISSMGLACRVPVGLATIKVIATWGTYALAHRKDNEDARPRAFRQRTPITKTEIIPLGGKTFSKNIDAGAYLRAEIRRDGTGHRVGELTLLNTREEPQNHPATATLFQPQLIVTAADGSFIPSTTPTRAVPSTTDTTKTSTCVSSTAGSASTPPAATSPSRASPNRATARPPPRCGRRSSEVFGCPLLWRRRTGMPFTKVIPGLFSPKFQGSSCGIGRLTSVRKARARTRRSPFGTLSNCW